MKLFTVDVWMSLRRVKVWIMGSICGDGRLRFLQWESGVNSTAVGMIVHVHHRRESISSLFCHWCGWAQLRTWPLIRTSALVLKLMKFIAAAQLGLWCWEHDSHDQEVLQASFYRCPVATHACCLSLECPVNTICMFLKETPMWGRGETRAGRATLQTPPEPRSCYQTVVATTAWLSCPRLISTCAVMLSAHTVGLWATKLMG